MVLKSIGVFSAGKIGAAWYGIIGLFAGLFFSLFSFIGGMAAQEEGSGILGAFVGVGAIIFMPLAYAALGFVGGIISAFIYNILAGITGGLELDLE